MNIKTDQLIVVEHMHNCAVLGREEGKPLGLDLISADVSLKRYLGFARLDIDAQDIFYPFAVYLFAGVT